MFSVGSYSGNSVRCASRCSAARRSSVRASVRSARCRRRRASSPAGLAPRRFRGRRAALSGAYVQPGLELETGEKGRRCGQIVGAERFVGAFEQPCVERAADDRDDIPPFRGGYVRFGDGSGRQRFAFRKGEPERLKGCDECLHGVVFFGVRTVPEASRALRNGFREMSETFFPDASLPTPAGRIGPHDVAGDGARPRRTHPVSRCSGCCTS